jgi:hypothetical protein
MPRLIPHPRSPGAAAALRIEANVRRRSGSALTVEYRVTGALDRVVVPALVTPGFADRLWEHTCFELFVAVDGEEAYHEFNFSPSGRWAVFGFSRYRERAETSDTLRLSAPPQLNRQTRDDALRLTVSLDLADLAAAYASARLAVGLSAVVELADGADRVLSYWALRHANPTPDFHRRTAFDLRVEADPPA